MSIIFLLLLIISSCTTVVLGAKDDKSTLLKIKQQLGNPSVLGGWVKSTNFCNWDGVTCSSSGRVVGLRLGNYINGNIFTPLSAPFPHAVCDLTELDSLLVFRSPFYGPIPSCINDLSKLRNLYISETKLSGPLPGFPYHQNLESIAINKNPLISGSILSSLSTLPNLTYLDLSSNNLTGTIPPGLVHNSSSVLMLYSNSLTGELPKCYGWADFEIFHVAFNQLSGDASFLFGRQKTAHFINLSMNEFAFDLTNVQIPQNLSVLELSHNKIWGRVPESLVSDDSLNFLDLSYNQLCGEIPQGGQLGQFNADSYANNLCLCGHPLPPCSNSAPTAAPAPASAPMFN